jgi:large subunit ribosomal protein L28
MSRCELTGKGPAVKNLVSHSNIKTKSVAMPNVQQKRMFSSTLGTMVNLKLATSTIRAIQHTGGFDKFVLNQDDKVLSKRAQEVKRRILRRLKSGGAISTSTANNEAAAQSETKAVKADAKKEMKPKAKVAAKKATKPATKTKTVKKTAKTSKK